MVPNQEFLADETTRHYTEECLARVRALRTYTVVVRIGSGFTTHTIDASSAQQRTDEMAMLGIDVSRSQWAAGTDHNNIAGNDPRAKQHLMGLLRR